MLLFKLAFHTYETLSNKEKIRKNRTKDGRPALSDTTTEKTDWDLISNMSDESTITMGGPSGPMKDRKMDRYEE